MRKVLVISLLAFIFTAISLILWQEEFRYALPTPIPVDYKEVPVGTCIEFPGFSLKIASEKNRFIHFFNPDCPCSRFNAGHFQYLYKHFGDQLDFMVVIPEGSSREKTQRILAKDISIVHDTEAAWSQAVGVYASPQAVIIDNEGELFYRGNYNKARFCTNVGSNYAEISLKMLLKGAEAPVWDFYATRSYGCQLPEYSSPISSLFFWSNENQNSPSIWKVKDSN